MKWFALFFCAAALGAEPSPEFKVDRGIVDKIYENSRREAGVDESVLRTAVEITPTLSFVTPSRLTLQNDYFEIPYGDSIGSAPIFSLALATPVTSLGDLMIFGQARVGYTYREGLFTASSKTGGGTYQDLIKLHWVPIEGMVRADYFVPGLSWLRPSLGLGVGAQWLYQIGKLDGVEQGFWVPYYSVKPAVTLFGSRLPGSWFGGVTAGVAVQNSFASTQTLKAISYDISVTLLL